MGPVYGADLAFLAAFKLQLINQFMLSSQDLHILLDFLILGSLAGVMLGGLLSYNSGRKLTLVGAFTVGLAGLCTSLLANAFSTLLLSQFVIGASLGIYFSSGVCYVAEVCAHDQRGSGGISLLFAVLLGALLVSLSRNLIGNSLLIAMFVILLYGLTVVVLAALKLPESPRYLVLTGASDEALSVLIRLRGDSGRAARELARINEVCRGEDRGIMFFLHSEEVRHTIWLLVISSLLMHLSGFSIIPYCFMDIIRENQFDFSSLKLRTRTNDFIQGMAQAALTVALFSSVCVALALRSFTVRKLVLFGTAMAAVLLISMFLLTFFELTQLKGLLLGALLLLYMFCASFVFNAFFMVFLPAILPTRGRDFGFTLVCLVNLVCFMGGQQLLEPLGNNLEISKFFALCALFCLLLLGYFYKLMPLVQRRNLEDLEYREQRRDY